jgi:hypothetical protein
MEMQTNRTFMDRLCSWLFLQISSIIFLNHFELAYHEGGDIVFV